MGLGGVELIMVVEDHFGIQISDEAASNLLTVEDLYRHVLHAIEHKPVSMDKRVCPRCRYSLRGLTKSSCPECGAEFFVHDEAKMRKVWSQLVDLIANEAGVRREEIKPRVRLIKDLGLD